MLTLIMQKENFPCVGFFSNKAEMCVHHPFFPPATRVSFLLFLSSFAFIMPVQGSQCRLMQIFKLNCGRIRAMNHQPPSNSLYVHQC